MPHPYFWYQTSHIDNDMSLSTLNILKSVTLSNNEEQSVKTYG
jgi:hypothetical protein